MRQANGGEKRDEEKWSSRYFCSTLAGIYRCLYFEGLFLALEFLP